MPWSLDRRQFLLWIALAWTCYAAIETVYIRRMPMVMDEFEGAHTVHQFASGLPYRDFDPYKTVLGYYLQLPALEAPRDLWRGMLAVKFEMAAAVLLAFGITTSMLRRDIDRGPLLLATTLLIFMSDFLERSADLRVDMLTALVGMLSFAFLIERRAGAAGALAALSVLVSQKGALYVVASAGVLAVDLLLEQDRGKALRRALLFGAMCAVLLAAYLLFWSLASHPHTVFEAVFGTAARVARNEAYAIRGRFWAQTLRRNPIYWLLAAAAVPVLLRRWREPALRAIAIYGCVILVLGAVYPQPWPYFFVILSPTIFVLHASLFQQLETKALRRAAVIVCVAGGILYPLARLRTTLGRSSAEQRWTIEFAHALLAPQDRYFAGIDMVWDRRQEPFEWRWLDAGTARQLAERSPEELRAVASQLRRAPIKLLIGSYRIAGLPSPLRQILDADFERLWGNVYLYAPRLRPGTFLLKFSGPYRLEAPAGSTVLVDGRPAAAGQQLALNAGTHTLSAQTPIRLQLLPEGWGAFADPRFSSASDLYREIYTY